jgi:hypothetical protein
MSDGHDEAEQFDPDDAEALAEAFTQLNDYRLASLVQGNATPEEMRAVLASQYTRDRRIATYLANLAMLLDRIPDSRSMVADELRGMADMLTCTLPPAEPIGEL